jgi:predicted RNA methylase
MPTSKFLSKDEFDRFYTKPSVVDNLLKEVSIEDYDVVVEPSAGTGSWSSKIDDCVAIDIAPEHKDVMKGNFLEDDFLFDEMKKENKILVIGNPPFGRMSNKAISFINKAAEFADTIAFILPRSFRKESLQRRIDKNLWLVKDVDLFEEPCFLFRGEDYFASCVFQVWEKRIEERDTTIKKIDPVGFSYVKR